MSDYPSFVIEPKTVHDAQTAILIWLWERGHPIMDREALEIVEPGDEEWCITIAGLDYIEAGHG